MPRSVARSANNPYTVWCLIATALFVGALAAGCHDDTIEVVLSDQSRNYGFVHVSDPCELPDAPWNTEVSACYAWQETVILGSVTTSEVHFLQTNGRSYSWWWAGDPDQFPDPPTQVYHGFYWVHDYVGGNSTRFDWYVGDPTTGVPCTTFDFPPSHGHTLDVTTQYDSDTFPAVDQGVEVGSDVFCTGISPDKGGNHYYPNYTTFVPPT